MVNIQPQMFPRGFNPKSNNYFDLNDFVCNDVHLKLQSLFDNINLPTGIEATLCHGCKIHLKKKTSGNPFVTSNAVLEASRSQSNRESPSSSRLAGSSSRISPRSSPSNHHLHPCKHQLYSPVADLENYLRGNVSKKKKNFNVLRTM
ncbi:hypothetical protein HanRHA438_Chr17g0805351 [Helianthus annuus]|nr:hypothetical protein HanRHA438_Chr17g0805351 [Helianthus annuus]